MSDDKYISIPQLALILGITRIAVYRKVKGGKIKAIRIGRNFAIPREEVNRIVGKIKGKPLNEEGKKQIDIVIAKTMAEYGEVIKRLGKE